MFALVPIFLLQFTYGMNTGFPAILTPQLAEEGAELTITADEESWIVSLDNLATPLVCVASGCLQQGPNSTKNIVLKKVTRVSEPEIPITERGPK